MTRQILLIILVFDFCIFNFSCADNLQDKVEDRIIEREIALKFIGEPFLDDIKVESYRGYVTLFGTVPREEYLHRVVELARTLVKDSDKLIVKIEIKKKE